MKFHYLVETLKSNETDRLAFFTRCGKVLKEPHGSFDPEVVADSQSPCQRCLQLISEDFPALMALRMLD